MSTHSFHLVLLHAKAISENLEGAERIDSLLRRAQRFGFLSGMLGLADIKIFESILAEQPGDSQAIQFHFRCVVDMNLAVSPPYYTQFSL